MLSQAASCSPARPCPTPCLQQACRKPCSTPTWPSEQASAPSSASPPEAGVEASPCPSHHIQQHCCPRNEATALIVEISKKKQACFIPYLVRSIDICIYICSTCFHIMVMDQGFNPRHRRIFVDSHSRLHCISAV